MKNTPDHLALARAQMMIAHQRARESLDRLFGLSESKFVTAGGLADHEPTVAELEHLTGRFRRVVETAENR